MLTFATLLYEAIMRERQLARLLADDQTGHYDETRFTEPDDELRAEACAELEVMMANAMLSQLGDDS